MSSIKEKLRALENQVERKPLHFAKPAISRSGDVPELEASFVENEHGVCLVREKKFSMTHVHGVKLAEFLQLSGEHLSLIGKDPRLVQLSPEDVVFLDTETTGLAGGTGTYIFLLGLGTFAKDCFVVKQFLMTDYSQEAAFLQEISTGLSDKQGIISYNGKSYDIPLLRTRFTINRMASHLDHMHHLDLLFTARRLWRRAITSCSLVNVERHILGFRRNGDIPGAEIPEIFFRFLKTENYELIKPICQHNAIDIVSMVSIAVKAHRVFAAQSESRTPDYDIYGIVKTLEDLGLYEKASDSITRHMNRSEEKESWKLLLRKAQQMKKLGRFDEAEKLWCQVIGQSREFILEPHLELAKCYEHRLGKIDMALNIVDRAIKRLAISSELNRSSSLDKELVSYKHRQNRLVRKKNRIDRIKNKEDVVY